MRTIFLFMNVSVDGYFEAPGHDISGFTQDFEAYSAVGSREVDTLLFGHRTYDMMKFWQTPQAEQLAPEIAKFINATPKFVASHQWFDPGWQNVTVISDNVPGAIRQLKEQPGKTIAMFGSNTLCVSLMQEDLMDEFQILVNPIAFGEGTSLFEGLTRQVPLKLQETHPLKSGTVLLTYVPAER